MFSIDYLLMQECVNSINNFLTAPYTAWFPITLIAATLIIVILAVVYLLAPLVGRDDIKRNISIMIYQTLFSIVLILGFGMFATWLCSFNVEGPLQNLNLILVNIPPGVHIPYGGNLYETALYDLYWFTNYGALANTNFFLSLIYYLLNIGPQLSLEINFIPGVQTLGFSAKGSFSLSNVLGSYIGYINDAISWLFIVNDLQFIIISAAPIIFAIFVSMGLIARIFGFSRSFGGSLIALGVGIGFVYPLMVSITYGFINVAYSQLIANMLPNVAANTFGASIQSALVSLLTGKALPNAILSSIYDIINIAGFTATASLILPLLNFIVVNTFVLDFSQAFGERLDFMSLLTSII